MKINSVYAKSIEIAVVICLLMWIVFLRVRTYYGNKTVNKLMLKTFRAANISLILKSVAVVLEVFQSAKLACIKQECSNDIFKPLFSPGFLLYAFLIVGFLTFSSYLYFIVYVFTEHRILWFFIEFQRATPFNQLDQKRRSY